MFLMLFESEMWVMQLLSQVSYKSGCVLCMSLTE